MKRSNAAKLSQRITFIKRNITLEEDSNYRQTLIKGLSAWACLTPVNNNLNNINNWHKGGENKPEAFYKLLIRKDININPLLNDFQAILWNGKILDIFYPFCDSLLEKDMLEAVVCMRDNGLGEVQEFD